MKPLYCITQIDTRQYEPESNLTYYPSILEAYEAWIFNYDQKIPKRARLFTKDQIVGEYEDFTFDTSKLISLANCDAPINRPVEFIEFEYHQAVYQQVSRDRYNNEVYIFEKTYAKLCFWKIINAIQTSHMLTECTKIFLEMDNQMTKALIRELIDVFYTEKWLNRISESIFQSILQELLYVLRGFNLTYAFFEALALKTQNEFYIGHFFISLCSRELEICPDDPKNIPLNIYNVIVNYGYFQAMPNSMSNFNGLINGLLIPELAYRDFKNALGVELQRKKRHSPWMILATCLEFHAIVLEQLSLPFVSRQILRFNMKNANKLSGSEYYFVDHSYMHDYFVEMY